jgi:ankyrin repeat protein
MSKFLNKDLMNKDSCAVLMNLAHGGDLTRMKSALPQTHVDMADDDGRTALMWATLGNRKKVVEYLLFDRKANPNALSNDKLTALCVAASYGYAGLIPALAPVTSDHSLPLRTAARHGYLEFATQLFKYGKVSELRGAILAAAATDHGHIARYFLKKATDPDGALFRSAIHSAVINGGLKTTKMLVGMRPDYDEASVCECHFSLLHLAAQHNQVKVAQYLIEELKADIEGKAEDGINPLHVAAGERHTEMIVFLRQAGANLHAKKTNGITAFHLACARGYSDIADMLFGFESDVHSTDIEGCTPIHSAAYGGFLPLVRKLVEDYGANPSARSKDGSTPMHAAVVNNSTEVLKYLSKITDVNVLDNDGRRPVRLAAADGYFVALRCLFEDCGADRFVADDQGWTLLHVAAAKGHLEVTKYLVQQGLSPNAKDGLGFTPLYYAAYSNRLECVKFLVEHTTVAENGGLTPLQIAAAHGNVDVVIALVTPRNINTTNDQGFTALMAAAMNNQLAVVKELLIQGADFECATKNGFRALHLAAEVGNLPIVKLLVKTCHATVDSKTVQGCTPLMCSVQNRHIPVAKWLVRKGQAAPRLSSQCGTAVEIAQSEGQKDASMLVLAKWLAKQCGHCGRWGRKLCTRCNDTYYCDGECQKNNWQKHKTDCGTC